MNKTINYYNENAAKFAEGTVNVDFTAMQDKFLAMLKEGDHILDFGCGAGRDTRYFMEKGFRVTATDGSEELCRIASEVTGTEVKHMMFDELDAHEEYEGVWACASILHVKRDELESILCKIEAALKPGGVLYTSFKYSSFEGERNGRYFNDLTEDMLEEIMKPIEGLKLEEFMISADVRPGREDEKWLNVFVRKV